MTTRDAAVSMSKVLATCGRVVHLYSNKWKGHRPGMVMNQWPPEGVAVEGIQRIDVNVMVHGGRDMELLAMLRRRPDGNTFMGVPLYDALTEGQRAAVLETSLVEDMTRMWAEWPPLPGPASTGAGSPGPASAGAGGGGGSRG